MRKLTLAAFTSNRSDYDYAYAQLSGLDSKIARTMSKIFPILEASARIPLSSNLPYAVGTMHPAVVVLGDRLAPDGSVSEILRARLETAGDCARVLGNSPIYVCGGNPVAGITEADAMAEYLVSQRISHSRITKEMTATGIADAAAIVARLLDKTSSSTMVLVTSTSDMRRAWALFSVAFFLNNKNMTLTTVCAPDPRQPDLSSPVSSPQMHTIYRDMLLLLGVELPDNSL